MANQITIRINNWDIYCKGNYKKNNIWFAIKSNFYIDPSFSKLSEKAQLLHFKLIGYIAMFGNDGEIALNEKNFSSELCRHFGTRKRDLDKSITELVNGQIVSINYEKSVIHDQTTTKLTPVLAENFHNYEVSRPNDDQTRYLKTYDLSNLEEKKVSYNTYIHTEQYTHAEPLGSLGIEKLNQEYKQPLETLRVSADADEIQNQENNLIIIPECVTHLNADNLDFHKQPKKDITLSNVESLEFIPTPRHCLVGGDDTLHYNNSKVPTIDENDLTLTETHISQKSLPDRRKTTKNDVLDSQAEEVLAFLNEKTGKSFRNVPANTKIVTRCIRNSSLEEVKKVVAFKCEQWGNDPRMKEYLRPATLFAVSNFENYLGQCADWKSVPTFDEIMTSFMKKYTQEELDQITERSHERGLQQFTNGEVYQ